MNMLHCVVIDPDFFKRARFQSPSSSQLVSRRASTCNVTCLLAAHGHLLVGTSCGHIVGLPIAQLEGVPLTSGKALLSLHHFNDSAVRFLVSTTEGVPNKGTMRKTSSLSLASQASTGSASYIDLSSLKRRATSTIRETEEEQAKSCNGKEEEIGDEGAASGGEPESNENGGYDPPWDEIIKNREKSPEMGMTRVNDEDSEELGVSGWNSGSQFVYEQDDLSCERSSSQTCHRLVLAGGEAYKWVSDVTDDAQVLVWSVDYS